MSDDLNSQAEEKEATLGRPLFLEEQAAILKASGHPMLVAMRYRNVNQQQLISPLIFPAYWFLLKVLLFITIVGQVIACLVLLASGGAPHQAIGLVLNLPRVLLPMFGWITLLFAVFDYLQAKFHWIELWSSKWNPL